MSKKTETQTLWTLASCPAEWWQGPSTRLVTPWGVVCQDLESAKQTAQQQLDREVELGLGENGTPIEWEGGEGGCLLGYHEGTDEWVLLTPTKLAC